MAEVLPTGLIQPRPSGWACSTCSELITRIEDGWVEWLACEVECLAFIRGVRLVHRDHANSRERCQYDVRLEFQRDQSIVEGLPLERFVGADGLMLLFSFISDGEMPLGEVIELAKRVQIPGYEQARQLFPGGIASGMLSPSIGGGFYLQSEIRSLLHWPTGAA
jgi:hypothetical protein